MSEINQESEKKEKGNKKVLIFLIALLIGLAGFSAYTGFKAFIEDPKVIHTVTNERDMEQVRAEKLLAEIAKAEAILKDLDYNNLDDMGPLSAKYKELQAEIDTQKQKIEELKTKMEELLAIGGAKDSDAFKALYYSLRNEVSKLKNTINELTAKNKELMAENDKLKAEKEKVEEELGSEKTNNKILTNEKVELKKKVAIGEKLHTYDVIAEGIKVKRNGTEKVVTASKRVESIRVVFTIAKNELTKAGTKRLHLKVTDPNSQVLTDGGSNFEFEGKQIAYTSMDDVDYSNSKKDVVMYAKNFTSDKFLPGVYNIQIYCEGTMIGEASVTFK
jgi:regulator of replication initiation timing